MFSKGHATMADSRGLFRAAGQTLAKVTHLEKLPRFSKGHATMADSRGLFRAAGQTLAKVALLQKLPRFSKDMRQWRIHGGYFGRLARLWQK